jgi:TonB-dependent SusC/RagA subfamily outer membrane receptor
MRRITRWALAVTAAGAAGCASRGAAPSRTAATPAPAGDTPGGDSVAVGYGSVARGRTTGAVGTVDGETSQRDGVLRVEEMLRRVPGVAVMRLTSGSYSVRVRGAKLGPEGSGEPLFVLDGMPLPVRAGALDNVSPGDVERIDVLKDAEAAIYGSQAANGVILVRTRRWRP